MLIAWATDIHWEFTTELTADQFIHDVRTCQPDALLLTGDISTATRVQQTIVDLETLVRVPVYYVYGNHDYYRGSFKLTRIDAGGLYLPKVGPVALMDGVELVGVDGWGDCGYGDPYDQASPGMSDWWEIRELHPIRRDRDQLVTACKKRGIGEALALRSQLANAYARSPRVVVVATHVPPWDGATWHKGMTSEPAWLPWFACKAVGDAICEEATRRPTIRHVVLCGHTHGAGVYEPLPNVVCYTGRAEYGAPALAGCVDVSDGRVTVQPL